MAKKIINPRLNAVGGQAVIEGVMMKHKDNYAITVRKPDDSIDVKTYKFSSIRKKSKILRLPIIRGFMNFIDMMILSYGTLNKATEMLGIVEEEEGKFEKWLKKNFGASILGFVMVIATILSLVLAAGMFILLPTAAGGLINSQIELGWSRAFVEGIVRVIILVLYLYFVSLIPDMKRVFQYHGAEHKSVFCYEAGVDMTVENSKTYKRFHPRCGTSFLFVLIIVSVVVSSFIPFTDVWLRTATKILVSPLIIGLGYEFLMYAGKHDNKLVKILTAPGLWMQRITTKEPDDKMLEVAIISLKSAMPDEFTNFTPPVSEVREAENLENTNNEETVKDSE
ncbi:MAG: hypothetical protein A2Y17_00175 [Clostridiales bacterium GWF2_38_85]|nr:MAG: hypothetical protein A2Y17_00175 [Clostridiales bacterium GWF2_38_85]HBL83876.1 DUF1385 domain-containing protein [Clostridiales bacterium]